MIELLIAMTITAAIGSAIGMTLFQLLSVTTTDKNRMEAVKQVENALHYLNRDAQSASSIVPTGADFPLVLTWNEWNESDHDLSGPQHQVTYSIISNKLERTEQIGANPSTMLVVANYVSDSSNCSINADNPPVLTVNLTASIGGFRPVSESRTLQVQSRPEPLASSP
jgi:hypothetical protein